MCRPVRAEGYIVKSSLHVGLVPSVWRFSTTYAQRVEQAFRNVLMAFCSTSIRVLMDLSQEHGHNRPALLRVAPIAVQVGKKQSRAAASALCRIRAAIFE